MKVKAKAKFIRISPRKVRLVANLVSGMKVAEARNQLTFSKKGAAGPVLKLLNSAVANAKHNFGLDENNLFIRELVANDGPTLKRYRPRAMGRAYQILKRTCNVHIEIDEIEETKKAKRAAVKKAKIVTKTEKEYEFGKKGKKETAGKKFEEEKGSDKGLIGKGKSFLKGKFFRRKSV